MICELCGTRWANFPVDITRQKMTREQDAERLAMFNKDDYRVCLNCQADMWEHTYYDDYEKELLNDN